MKQKLLKALSLAAIALCSVSSAWADRVAPTLPPAVEPQVEKDYGIYCPEADKFMAFGDYVSGNYKAKLSESSFFSITITSHNSHYVLHQGARACLVSSGDEGHWFYANWTYAARPYFDLIKNGEGYYLQYTDNSKYVSYSGDAITFEQEATVHWQFIAADKASHYIAEKALFDALNATDGRGWMRDEYEQMYNNRATATNLELHQAANKLNNALQTSAISGLFYSQNDYTNWMISSLGWEEYNSHIRGRLNSGETTSITATVETTENADLSYTVGFSYTSGQILVYIDEELVRSIQHRGKYNHALKPGKHTIKWAFENTADSYGYAELYCIGAENTPLITVNCPLPGSLGTEILYNVDGLKDVRNLKVIGDLNADDMTRLTMLTNAHYIDLSEATCTANVPERAFYQHSWLHTLRLAEGIKNIGSSAFYDSVLENVSLPSTLTSIDGSAFSYTNLKSVELPYNVTTLGDAAFSYCYDLENVNYSEGLTYVPNSAFYHCSNLKPFEIPEGVTEIGESAFAYCPYYIPTFPSTLKSIKRFAFEYCDAIETLVVPDAVDYIGIAAFRYCKNLAEATMPMNFYNLTENVILDYCDKLKKITLNSPTLVQRPFTYTGSNERRRITNDERRPNITLCVPDYLVVPYKLDSYWYNFGDIVGFPAEHIKDYTLHTDLYLDSHSRINGDPNLTIENGALRIEGDAAMGITNFQTTTAFNNYYHNNNFSSLSQVRSGCENITIKGDYTHWMKLYGSRWAFVSLPFDCKVRDITDLTEGRLHAVRYYDGAERAATGTGSSWKKFASEDAIIPAGQGFIIQVDGSTSNYGWIQFKSQDNASKQYVFSKKEFSKHLDKNPSSVESNQGWNLVGNPYQCYYNIHNLNFTAPITVWDGSNRTYAAYSISDDDYALRPNEAFFVQCPSALDAITFPVGGKQFDATILTQNASQRRAAANSGRKMLNLTLSNDEATDQTRIVINDEASLGYETTCDASKFMSMDNTVAQLYTLDAQGTQYAINERPYDDGFVQLGASFATDGTYTIALTHGDMGSVFLTDLETGETTDLTLSEYTFHANAGTDNGRFLLSFAGEGTLTAIEALTNNSTAEYYTIDGRHMGNNRSALGKGVYVVRSGNRSAKILVD